MGKKDKALLVGGIPSLMFFLSLFIDECTARPLLSPVQVRLPDVEFFVNLGDWPLEKRKPTDNNLHPIFSWCGSNNTRDIVMPTYDLTESVLETMGRWVTGTHWVRVLPLACAEKTKMVKSCVFFFPPGTGSVWT